MKRSGATGSHQQKRAGIWRGRAGAVAPMVAVSLIPVVGVMAFVCDIGTLLDARRQAQGAADLAALAAAADLYAHWKSNAGSDTGGTAKSSALVNAKANGFDNDATTNTVTVTQNPSKYQGGQFEGTTIPVGYVEVVIQSNQNRLFSKIWNTAQLTTQGYAVARASYKAGGPAGATILVLEPSGSSVNLSGSGTVNLNGGTFVVDSSSSSALVSSGSPSLEAGGFYFSGSPGYLYSGTSPFETPTGATAGSSYLHSAVTATPDPLHSLTEPSVPSSDGTYSVNGGAFSSVSGGVVTSGSPSVTLTPGYYPSVILGSGGGTFTFQPGIYYFHAGVTLGGTCSINVSGPSSADTGTGVLFYSDGGGGITLSGSGSWNIPAPTTGTYEGMSIFMNRTSSSGITISGSTNQTIGGTVYAADSTLTVSGSGTATIGSTTLGAQYICYAINMSGSGSYTLTGGGGGGTPVRTIQLVQ